MNKDLLPCSCCGAEAHIDMGVEPHKHVIATFMPDVTGYTAFIVCPCGIGLAGDQCETKELAIQNVSDKWNTRTEPKKCDPRPLYMDALDRINGKCNNCNTHIYDVYNYCPGCGKKIDWNT